MERRRVKREKARFVTAEEGRGGIVMCALRGTLGEWDVCVVELS